MKAARRLRRAWQTAGIRSPELVLSKHNIAILLPDTIRLSLCSRVVFFILCALCVHGARSFGNLRDSLLLPATADKRAFGRASRNHPRVPSLFINPSRLPETSTELNNVRGFMLRLAPGNAEPAS